MKLKHIAVITLSALSFSVTLMAQDRGDKDPFVEGSESRKIPPAHQNEIEGGSMTVLFEMFSLPLQEAAQLIRSDKTDTQIYESLVKSSKQEAFVLMRGRSGDKFMTEAVHEHIYPTTYEPPELPETLGVQIVSAKVLKNEEEGVTEVNKPEVPETEKLSKAPSPELLSQIATPATPSAFETRNTGLMVEIEPIVRNDKKTVEVRIMPSFVHLLGTTTSGQGLAEAKMPHFETQRLKTAYTARVGRPYLLGTMNRSPFSKLEGADKIWFAMVTVKPVKQ